MQWIIDHFSIVISVLLAVSEAASTICQLLFPNNQGISGILASIIKFLQGLKKPTNE